MKHLKRQSTKQYNLLKNEQTNIYFVECLNSGKVAKIGNKEKSESFIIYGIKESLTELKQLKFN
jgi:hypothetical protein